MQKDNEKFLPYDSQVTEFWNNTLIQTIRKYFEST